MKKAFLVILPLMLAALTGCPNKDSGSAAATGYGNCGYGNSNIYNGNMAGNMGFNQNQNQIYRYNNNNQCVDTRNNQIVGQNLCQQGNMNMNNAAYYNGGNGNCYGNNYNNTGWNNGGWSNGGGWNTGMGFNNIQTTDAQCIAVLNMSNQQGIYYRYQYMSGLQRAVCVQYSYGGLDYTYGQVAPAYYFDYNRGWAPYVGFRFGIGIWD